MNILIKLTCLVGLVIAPILGEMYGEGHANAEPLEIKEVVTEKIDMIQLKVAEEKTEK